MSTLYEVKDAELPDAQPRLIDAANQAHAIRYCASRFTASPANPRRVAELVGAGVKVEQANGKT